MAKDELDWYTDDWAEEDDDDIENYEEDNPITPEQKAFGDDIKAFLQSLIDNEGLVEKDNSESGLEEKFTSQQGLIKHFQKHCLANVPGRVSTKSNVYYDFNTIKKYFKYEQKISMVFRKGQSDFINDIYDSDEVNKKFTALFKGNKYLFISGIFGLRNSKGIVNIGIHSFSSDVTTNYDGGNTIDICIMSQSPNTITLYPVDASLLKRALLKIIKKYSTLSLNISQDDKKLLNSLHSGNSHQAVLKEAEDDKKPSYLDELDLKSNGIYSLKYGWLKHPEKKDIPEINKEEFDKEFDKWENRYFDLLDEVEKSIDN